MKVTQMNYAEFFRELEISIRDSIRTCYPYSWDENHVSFTITQNFFMRHMAVSLEGLDRPFKILWDVRKLRLPEEATNGDIGVIVRLITWAGETLEGVGLLEAKKRDIGKNTFSATKSSQLKRILSNVPSARLMLYDYDNVSSCMDNWSIQLEDRYCRWHHEIVQPFTHCVCLPAGIALRQGRFTTELHKFGVPLSYQLVGRYFRGFDLEFDLAKVQAVKNNALRHGGPRTLLLVGVSIGASEPILPEVNSNLYGRIA